MNNVIPLPTGLTPEEMQGLSNRWKDLRSPSTVRTYDYGWRTWEAWAKERRRSAFPARPADVAVCLHELAQSKALKTVGTIRTAISDKHRQRGLADPTAHEAVRRTYRAIAATASPAKRARPLTQAVLHQLADVMDERDDAMIRTMRDGLLRISEAAALTWGDIARDNAGGGTLFIARSKTDQSGEGAYQYLARPTLQALDRLVPGPAGERVFGISARQIARRIKKLAVLAGLGDGFSGHSPRVGMAVDLAAAGEGIPALSQAGRWTSSAMPIHYTRQAVAQHGAVARFYRRVAAQK